MHAVRHSPSRGNWIWLAGAVPAIAVLAVVASRYGQAGCRAAGATPPPGAGRALARPGRAASLSARPFVTALALYYDPGTAAGSCSLGPFPPGGRYVSLAPRQYDGGAACGSYLDVRGPRGQVRVEVVDLCPGCDAGTINLSRAAFGLIADPGPGSATVTYRPAADPPLPGPIMIWTAAGSTPATIAVQILNHGNPLTSVAVGVARPAGLAWDPLTLRPDDFWDLPAGLGGGPLTLRITDDLGHRVLLPHLTLLPGRLLATRAWMYRAGPAGLTPRHPAGTTPAASHPGC